MHVRVLQEQNYNFSDITLNWDVYVWVKMHVYKSHFLGISLFERYLFPTVLSLRENSDIHMYNYTHGLYILTLHVKL